MFRRMIGKKAFEYRCAECGETHTGPPSFSFKYPAYVFDVPEDEWEQRVFASDDLCRILPGAGEDEDAIYCIRTILEIPIIGLEQPFTWGVWVSQSEESFGKYVATFDTDQSGQGSFGWLAVTLPYYRLTAPGTPLEHLECDVVWGPPGKRPTLTLWYSEHQLAIDQRDGINWEKAVEIATLASGEFAGTCQ